MSSSLIVEVCKINDVSNHPNGDNIEIAKIKGWQCIVPKGKYKKNDVVIYIPPDFLIPNQLADDLGVRNYLAGSSKDRVKCIKLRGEISEGLIIDVPEDKNWKIGYECSQELGIVKYNPPVRTSMGNCDFDDPFFDKFTNIENIKNYPNVFEEGEEVVITEKVDGTLSRILCRRKKIWIPFFKKIEWKCGSHNVIRKKPKTKKEWNENIYWYPYKLKCVRNLLFYLVKKRKYKNVILYGELYGAVRGGHKLMHYGIPHKLGYVVFAIKVDGEYINYKDFRELCNYFFIPMVPLIGITKFNFDTIKVVSQGNSILAEEHRTKHMREGIVITSLQEKKDEEIGRKILKMINFDYIIMKEKKSEKGEIVDYTDI